MRISHFKNVTAKIISPILICFLLFGSPQIVQAGAGPDYYVNPNGTDAPGCGVQDNPCKTITYTLQLPQITSGDKIYLSEGTFIEPASLDIVTDGLTIIGAGESKTFIDGGGLHQVFNVKSGAKLTLTDLTVQNGYLASKASGESRSGAGIYNAGTLSIVRSEIRNNIKDGSDSDDLGGGITQCGPGKLTLTQVYMYGNKASRNRGNAIFQCGAAGDLTIQRSAIVNNLGNAINVYAEIYLTNSTVSGNAGSGLLVSGTAHISYSTFTDNELFPIHVGSGQTAEMNSSIVVANGPVDYSGKTCFNGSTVTSKGYNITYSSISGNCNLATPDHDQIDVNPLLEPLALNGSNLPTNMPGANSPALNQIPSRTNMCGVYLIIPALGIRTPTYGAMDQRGMSRPLFGSCDIGAVERNPMLILPQVLK